VDVSDITVEYDLAAQMGRFMGLSRCRQLYNRCDLSSEDMVRMIKTEMETLEKLRTDLESEQLDLNDIEGSEVAETEVEFKKLEEEDDDGFGEDDDWGDADDGDDGDQAGGDGDDFDDFDQDIDSWA